MRPSRPTRCRSSRRRPRSSRRPSSSPTASIQKPGRSCTRPTRSREQHTQEGGAERAPGLAGTAAAAAATAATAATGPGTVVAVTRVVAGACCCTGNGRSRCTARHATSCMALPNCRRPRSARCSTRAGHLPNWCMWRRTPSAKPSHWSLAERTAAGAQCMHRCRRPRPTQAPSPKRT